MRKSINIPRLVIAAPHGQSGKTTVTLGLLGALTAKGLKVQPFKKGPDFIDPSWLSVVARRTCRNMDCYLLDESSLLQSFAGAAQDADLAIVEGAMGLYDGLDMEGSGSTAQIAKYLKAPVILVLDCRRMTRSGAAVVMGFQHFDPEVKIAGVILNHVAGARHRRMLENCIRDYCGLPVLGVVPKSSGISIPNRHLGLVPASENEKVTKIFQTATALMMENLNLEAILELAKEVPPLEYDEPAILKPLKGEKPTIGVLRDRVFSFYYPENLESLASAGANVVYIDSLAEKTLPEVDALVIGGGFPELFGEELNNNRLFMESLKEQIEEGLPVYAECGGMMFLGRSITADTTQYPMVGVLPFDGIWEKKPQGHGYTLMESIADNPLMPKGTFVKGHEFSHIRMVNMDLNKMEFAYRVHRGRGIDGVHDGLIYKNVFASYNHLHALGSKEWAPRLVALAQQYRKERQATGARWAFKSERRETG